MIYISSAFSPFRWVFGFFLFSFVCFKPKICKCFVICHPLHVLRYDPVHVLSVFCEGEGVGDGPQQYFRL